MCKAGTRIAMELRPVLPEESVKARGSVYQED